MLKPRLSSIYRRITRLAKVRGPRELGDAARDRRDWLEAAQHYRRHLERQPDDKAIWVQLGHALKELRQFDEALSAYEEALRFDEADADLLLNFGHLYKLKGDDRCAASFYRRSANLNGNPHALDELGRLETFFDVILDDPTVQQQEMLEWLARCCEGVRPVAVADVVREANGRHLGLTSHDPWIVLEIESDAGAAAGLGLLTIQTTAINGHGPLAGRLYIDYGLGFHEKSSLRCQAVGVDMDLILAGPKTIQKLRWDPDDKPNAMDWPRITYRSLSDEFEIEALIRKVTPPDFDPEMANQVARSLINKADIDPKEAAEATQFLMGAAPISGLLYRHWLAQYQTPTPEDYARISTMTSALRYKPKFSFVMPTYNTPPELLRACLDAMLAQTYPDFEVCVADDNSPDPEVAMVIAGYAARDPRVKFVRRETNGHISAASNSALRLATGEFIVLMDHDDLLPDYALFVVAHYINLHPDADILYSDEDKIDYYGNRTDPYFKGGFNKFLMYGHNMISHLGVYRRRLVESVGGFRRGFEGSQDYDLFLRCYEQTLDARVIHIPYVLYHWRMVAGSTAVSADQKSYAAVAARNAIDEHFQRTGMALRSVDGFAPGVTAVEPTHPPDTSVSIIVPTRNGLGVLEPCIRSILAVPDPRVEVIIVDNGSDDPATIAYLGSLTAKGLAKVIPYPDPFNFSKINNHAAAQATGDILCFLNNDTEVLAPAWLARARGLLALDEVGVVGARLLFPDGHLQHFGIVVGMGSHGVASTPHAGLEGAEPGYFAKARLIQEFSAVTAACLFIRRETFGAVGGFEPELRVAYNDVDLCLKVRALGLKVLADPEILLVHKESRTRGRDDKGPAAERLQTEASWMRRRWSAVLDADPYYSPNLALNRVDFGLATPPRAPPPWRTDKALTGSDPTIALGLDERLLQASAK
jgi:glycosyltransferase involved in cell wall biosynthesis